MCRVCLLASLGCLELIVIPNPVKSSESILKGTYNPKVTFRHYIATSNKKIPSTGFLLIYIQQSAVALHFCGGSPCADWADLTPQSMTTQDLCGCVVVSGTRMLAENLWVAGSLSIMASIDISWRFMLHWFVCGDWI